MKTQITQPKKQETAQPKAENQAPISEIISGYGNTVAQREVIQRDERKTTIYAKNGQTWKKNMEIIDSASASDYVHLSRSTTSDSESFPTTGAKANTLTRDGSRGTKEESVTGAFDRANYNEANNTHITLEGRYVDVLKSVISGADNSAGIKSSSPASTEGYANLNFGKDPVKKSEKTIQNFIEETATAAKANIPEEVKNYYDESEDEIIAAVDKIEDSTLAFANTLITSTPFLNRLQDTTKLNHYGGAVWAPDWKKK